MALVQDGKFPTDIAKSLKELEDWFNKCSAMSLKNLDAFKKSRSRLFKRDDGFLTKGFTYYPEMIHGLTVEMSDISGMSLSNDSGRYGISNNDVEGCNISVSKGLIGGAVLARITSATPGETVDAFKILVKTKLILAKDKENDKAKIDKISVLSKAEMLAAINLVISICDEVIKFRTNSSQLNEFKRDLYKDLDLANNLDMQTPEHKTVMENIKRVTRYYLNNLDQPIVSLCSHIVKVNGAVVDYCKQSINRREKAVQEPASVPKLALNK